MDEQLINRKMARRRLLRRAGTVAAGVAGASAVGASLSSPAQAAPGDNMIVGQANAGVGNSTALSNNSASNPTMVLGNASDVIEVTPKGDLHRAGAPLQFVPSGDYVGGPVGSLGASTDGTLWTTLDVQGTVYTDFVRSGINSTVTRVFSPVRILDTRPTQVGIGKNSMINEAEAVDADGFIKGGFTLNISLDAMFVFAEAILCNVTVVAGGIGGYVTLYPGGQPKPLASNVNFAPGQVVANFAIAGLDATLGFQNVLSIFALQPAKVIIDVSGAIVNFDSDILPISNPPGFAATQQSRLRQRPPGLTPGGTR